MQSGGVDCGLHVIHNIKTILSVSLKGDEYVMFN